MSDPKTYYVMSISDWRVCFDGTHEQVNTFIETAIAANSRETFIITCNQIPTIRDCALIRKDRFTATQRRKAEEQAEREAREAAQTCMCGEPTSPGVHNVNTPCYQAATDS